MNVLCICTGNTCRSPMAEGIFRKLFQDNGRSDITVQSAGLSASDGQPASRNAVLALNEIGIDISSHRSRQATKQILQPADIIYVVSENHRQYLGMLFPEMAEKCQLLCQDIPDPYGGDLEIYRKTRDIIWQGCQQRVNELLTR